MGTFARVAITAIVVIATYFFVFWVPGSILVPGQHFWIAGLMALAAAWLAGRFVWRRTATMEQGLLAYAALGALIVGGIGFVVGFFGPLIWAPDANQGPLLGLFITGPLGFLIGGIGGFLYGLVNRSRPQRFPSR